MTNYMIVYRQRRREGHTDVAGTEVNGLLRGISLLHLDGLCGMGWREKDWRSGRENSTIRVSGKTWW